VLIARLKYVNKQKEDYRNLFSIHLLRDVIYLHEERAAEQHGFIFSYPRNQNMEIENEKVDINGHITQYWK